MTNEHRTSPDLSIVTRELTESFRLFSEQVRARLLKLAQMGQALNRQIEEAIGTAVREAIRPIAEIVERIRDIDPEYLEALRKAVQQIVADPKQVHLKLAYHGWYLPASQWIPASDMINLTLILGQEPDKAEGFMSEWIEGKMVTIQEILIEKYPARKQILEAGFRAHEAGDYFLSIPIFLAQADGIYVELSGAKRSLYSKTPEVRGVREPRSKQVLSTLGIDEEMSYALEPLRVITALIANSADVEPGLLNRHAVMHGLDCDYGTKVNSLKAISHLLYVGTFLDETRRAESCEDVGG